MSIPIINGIDGSQTLRSFPDESGEELPENVSWPVELAWSLSGKRFAQSVEATIGDNDTYTVAITTPNTTDIILLMVSAKSSAGATVTIYEDSTVTGGTPVTMRNYNRTMSDTTATVVVEEPTVTVAGTAIYPAVTLGSTTGWGVTTDVAGSASGGIRLKPNTTYVYQVDSTANDNIVEIVIDVVEDV